MAKMTKEEQQFRLEQKHKLREKQLLQLKASNEMLESAKKGIIDRYGKDSDTAQNLLNDIDVAKDQNIERANTYLNASKEEMESGTYHDVDPKEAEAYYKRLETQHKSDEILHMKNIEDIKEAVEKVDKKAKPVKKSKSKLSELTDKLKQLKKNNNENIQIDEPTVIEEPIPEPIKGEIKRDYEPEDNTFIEDKQQVKEKITEYKDTTTKVEMDSGYKDFDPRDIPSYVQYDMIPLPSKGECYAHKKDRIPVAYLTAADENLITSRNLYNSGSMIDIILERKILDKTIRVADLCKGDRDAIAIWLRATAYGSDYPVIALHEGKEIETIIDLNNIEYLDFNLKGDENGWFNYKLSNGDTLKFKVMSHGDEEKILRLNDKVSEILNRNAVIKNINSVINAIRNIDDKESSDVIDAMTEVKNWANKVNDKFDDVNNVISSTYVTDRMFFQTMAVNGNTDREFIKNYIENMRAKDAFEYRKYLDANIPGVNLEINVPIPESQGGGSFKTFLSIGESVFINV